MTYNPIDNACIDKTNIRIVNEDEPGELDVEELENLLYEEGSIPINKVEGSSSAASSHWLVEYVNL